MSFNLATSVSELRGSEYVNRRVIQVPATREINNGNFFRSDQTFRWNIAGNSWWSPAQSYFRIRSTLVGPAGAPLKASDNLAPAFCFMDCMYRSASFSMNGIRVSQITDYMPQIAALKNRHGKSRDYREGVGNSLAFYDTDFYRRQARVIVDGVNNEFRTVVLTKTELTAAVTNTLTITVAGLLTITVAGGSATQAPFFESGDVVTFNTGANQQTVVVTGLQVFGGTVNTNTTIYNSVPFEGKAIANLAGLVLDDDTKISVKRMVPVSRALGAGSFETVWSPPLGITELSTFLPAGQYEYNFSPQQLETALKLCIESNDGNDKTSPANFTLTMDSIEFYCVTVEQARVDSLDYLIDLKEMSCVPFTITNANWTSNMLIVPPSTSRLTVAYQDTKVSAGTQYPVSKFIAGANLQDLITRFNVTYANVVYPSNDLDLKLQDTGGAVLSRTQRFTQAYNDMLLANGSAFSDTTSESLLEWLNNGFYLSYPTVKESKDTSTQVMIKQQFSAAVPETQLLLFANYGTITSVSIKSGQVVSVSTVEA